MWIAVHRIPEFTGCGSVVHRIPQSTELTVTTLAGVSRAWWKAVNRFDVSDGGRALKKQTRRKIDSK